MMSNRVALSIAVLSIGCGDNVRTGPDAPSVATQNLIAQISVSSDGDSNLVAIGASFSDAQDPEQNISLDPEDSLSATLRGQTLAVIQYRPLVALPDEPLGEPYEAFFDIDPPIVTSEDVVFELVRHRWDSTTVTVTIPGFAIDPVTSPASRASDLVVAWSPVDDSPMSYVVYGDTWLAPVVGDVDVPGDGSLTVPAKSLTSNANPTVTVSAGVAFERDAKIPVGAPFAGGQITTAFTARALFTSTP